jgi:hypothetical protein
MGPFAIYVVCAVAAFMIGRKIGISRWLRIALALLGPIGLIGTLIGLYSAWRRGIPIVAAQPDDDAAKPGGQLP